MSVSKMQWRPRLKVCVRQPKARVSGAVTSFSPKSAFVPYMWNHVGQKKAKKDPPDGWHAPTKGAQQLP